MNSAVNTFLAVLFVTVFVLAFAFKRALGADASGLQWAIFLAVVFSAVLAWLRWKMLQRRESPPRPAAASKPAAPPASVDARLPPVPVRKAPAEPLPTARQAIVFRQHFPPLPEGSTLSFFGGAPIAPSGFRWPRSTGKDRPFSFLMQIDCAEVPPHARLQLLPDRGVLYFFLDLEWGEPNAFRVLYEERVDKDSAPIRPPDDLEPAFGAKEFVWHWPQSAEDSPRLLPRWTFQPVAIAIPTRAVDPDDEDGPGPALWPGEKATAEALRIAQGDEVVSHWFSGRDFAGAGGALIRPFANFPHDWRAVQIASGLLLRSLRDNFQIKGAAARRGMSDAERDAVVARAAEQARSWYTRAAAHAPFDAVPQTESDDFWASLAEHAWLVGVVIKEAVILSIEASLADSSESASRIPADVARRLHDRHALASRSEHGPFTRTPHRMLAPPVDVQGNQWERAQTHLLLLELSSDEGLGHHFGEGVLQFWITPEDLKARRFDKVELTTDAY